MKRLIALCLFLVPLLVSPRAAHAQGVTTGAIIGTVVGPDGQPVSGASIIAVHVPSGTRYGTVSRDDGRFAIPGMRVGGPYTVTVSHIGFEATPTENVYVNLGASTDLRLTVHERAVELQGITVTAAGSGILSSERTGATTTVSRDAIQVLPTVSQRIEDFARLTPQYSSVSFGFSFAGQDNRMNNMTVDGSYFNNSFGLAGQPGDRTGVAPISLEAIEQLQVAVAPFDVRQGNFVGAGVNTVTRSGTNELRGSIYRQFRNDGYVGKTAGDNTVDPGTFTFHNTGGWISGPIIRDKLFFFADYEDEARTEPGTTFLANAGGQEVGGNVTRVLASDLDALSSFLSSNFNYTTGPYQGYDSETPAKRFIGKLDYNVNDRNKLSIRYNLLNSKTDVLESNSSSLGFGSRRTSTRSLNFQNSNYIILENIRSVVGEWNSTMGPNKSNNLILGYTYQDESRESRGTFFPLVDILQDGSTYTSFGFEPFTPANQLRYGTYQLQDNFSIYGDKHTLTFGASAERYHSDNVFFPGSQSAYVYNSLDDFYTDANDYLANPNRTTSPVTLRRFQVRWSNIPGQTEPLQPLTVFYGGLYAQDEWHATRNIKLTFGLRADVPFFGDTGFDNPQADALTFRDENNNPVQYDTKKLPDANILWSPRIGFNWDVKGDRSTQVRGGTGIFTGSPAFVWISNQIGNTGVLTGFERLDNTTARPFNPDPDHYKPTNVTGQPASSYELALTDPNFKFPQLWRTDLAVDQKLPGGLIGTAEFLYNHDVNGIYYINANLSQPDATFSGADNRPRWTNGNRINDNVDNAVVLKNQDVGHSWNISASLEKPFSNGFFVKGGFSYGVAKNTVDPGSIAFGSWNNNPHPGNPNDPGVGFSQFSPGTRIFGAVSYRANWLDFGATTISVYGEDRTLGNASYVYNGDLNGDGGFSNDLIYIPKDMSEMNFQTYTTGGQTFTAAQQAQAWENYIEQDDYLSSHRGQYAERNAVFLPMAFFADMSIAQDLFTDISGKRNSLQLRADILNVTNLLNHDWGIGKRFVNTRPLIARGADAEGRATYRLTTDGDQLISRTFEPTASLGDVYRIQLSLRYTFN